MLKKVKTMCHLARAGVAISVCTAMDMGTPPQWMLPRVSFRAMLNLEWI